MVAGEHSTRQRASPSTTINRTARQCPGPPAPPPHYPLRPGEGGGGLDLSLVFIHIRFMASPVVHVLSGGLFSVKQGQKALPIGARIAGDEPGFHRWQWAQALTSACASSLAPEPKVSTHEHGASERNLRSASHSCRSCVKSRLSAAFSLARSSSCSICLRLAFRVGAGGGGFTWITRLVESSLTRARRVSSWY